MSKAKFTSGPWRVRDYVNCVEVLATSRPPVVNWQGFDDSDRPMADHVANARLIAASPDLLAACQLALPHLVNEPAADAVRAAIAKATGGPPT